MRRPSPAAGTGRPCYHNAAIENWFGTLKRELGEAFESIGDARRQLFDGIEVFYNRRGGHTSLGKVSPAEFEAMALA